MNLIIMHINYGELMGGSIGNKSIGDICAMAKKLVDLIDSPAIGIEAPRPGDRTGFARQDLAYFRSVWGE